MTGHDLANAAAEELGLLVRVTGCLFFVAGFVIGALTMLCWRLA